MRTIFIVEDDEDIRELIAYALENAGFASRSFEDGLSFFLALQEDSSIPDLVLLDIMLPGLAIPGAEGQDGLSILKKLRSQPLYKNLPIIMLTAKGSEADKVKGLNFGADDYIAKPFGVTELIARINALLRRTSPSSEEKSVLVFKNLSLDTEKHLVLVDGKSITLTFLEFELLRYLLLNAQLVMSREKLTAEVWGYDFLGESRTVDMHIKSLRKKLGQAGSYIKTIRSVGYKIGE